MSRRQICVHIIGVPSCVQDSRLAGAIRNARCLQSEAGVRNALHVTPDSKVD